MNRLLLTLLLMGVSVIFAVECRAADSFQKAVELYGKKDYRAAQALFSQVITARPRSPTAYYYEALCYQQLGDSGRAKQFYKCLVDSFPSTPEAKLANTALSNFSQAARSQVSLQAKSLDHQLVSGQTDLQSAALQAAALTTQSLPKDPAAAIALTKNLEISDEDWRKLPEETKIPFKRATSSHLFVDGYVNGRFMHMMFDTGAENCHFSRQDLAAAGVKFEPGGPKIAVGGVAGTAYCSMMVADVSVGDITRHIPVLISDTPIGFPIIGETFFKAFRYDIDPQGFIHFIKKSRPGIASHTYESTDLIKIPFENQGNEMVVQAKVNGKPIPMIFDTGANSITFSAMHAAALGLQIPRDAQMVAVSGAGGTVRAYMFPVDRIELGPILETHVTVVVNQAMTPSLPLLGQPFYKNRRFTIDNESHLIKFVH